MALNNRFFIFDDIKDGEVLGIEYAFLNNSVEIEKDSDFYTFELINYSNDKSYNDGANIISSYKINDSNTLYMKIDLINDKGMDINAITLRNLYPTILLVNDTKMYFYRLSDFVEEIIIQGEDTMATIKEEEEEDLSDELEFYGRYFDFEGEEEFSIVRKPLDILMGMEDDTEIKDEDGHVLFTLADTLVSHIMIDIDEEQLGAGYSVLVDHAINGQAQIMGYDDYQPPIFKGELTEQQGSGYFADLGQENVGGQMVISGYDDNNPPVFTQDGGDFKLLDKKINHITNYIIKRGEYKLPKYVLDDIEKLEQ
tara:strand:- start:6456 stop:7388 length:933 start_codon:yes stop_codon:yes gene_type:complete